MSPSNVQSPQRTPASARWVIGLSIVNLLALCVVSYLLYVVSETWWVGTVLTYAPRTPYLIPTLMLLAASLFWHRASIGINLIAAAIVLVPIMGLSIPLELLLNGSPKTDDDVSLKILSCNVQAFKPDFDRVLEEIAAVGPDIVGIQEAFRGDPRLDDFFKGWYTLRHHGYWIGSRYPLTWIADLKVPQFGERYAGMVVRIETPGGSIVFANVHQMTARFGLKELNRKTLINGDGTKELESFEEERYLESIAIRSIVDAARENQPLIVCGDFNTPTSSSLFRSHWSDLKSSFDAAGFGYGYTSPCKGNRFWPDNVPWARIDHILCSNEFVVRSCHIGKTDGSDHRLITSTVVFDSKKTAASASE